MGKGGARIGAGRKPNPNSVRSLRRARQQATVLQHPSSPPAPPLVAVPVPVLDEADAPNDLNLEQRRVWMELAPLAMQNGRLTSATSDAFKAGCRWVVIERACAASVTDQGSSTHDRAMKWASRFYAEFSLTPGGKPMADPKLPAVDEDEAFFGGSSATGG